MFEFAPFLFDEEVFRLERFLEPSPGICDKLLFKFGI